jgi:hypothetical protein
MACLRLFYNRVRDTFFSSCSVLQGVPGRRVAATVGLNLHTVEGRKGHDSAKSCTSCSGGLRLYLHRNHQWARYRNCAVHDGNGGGQRAAQVYEPPPTLLSIP